MPEFSCAAAPASRLARPPPSCEGSFGPSVAAKSARSSRSGRASAPAVWGVGRAAPPAAGGGGGAAIGGGRDDSRHFGQAANLLTNDFVSLRRSGVLDSLGLVQLVLMLEDRFGLPIDRDLLA